MDTSDKEKPINKKKFKFSQYKKLSLNVYQNRKFSEISSFIKSDKNTKKEMISMLVQTSKYTLIGFLCFCIDFLVFLLLAELTNIHYLLASAIGYFIGVIVNYGFSISWVFKKRKLRGHWKTEFTIFMIIECIAILIMSSSLYVFEEVFIIPLAFSKIIANILAALWNYIMKYFFLFRKDPEKSKKRFLKFNE